MERESWSPAQGDIVRIHGQTTYDGELAEVVQIRKRRQSRWASTRCDYLLLMGNGQKLWFSEAEIRAVESQSHIEKEVT